MSGFEPGWLALREPADRRARSLGLLAELCAWLTARPHDNAAALTVIDLGGGTGANLRWLAPQLGSRQDWLVVDNDPALLDALAAELRTLVAAAGLRLTPEPTANRTWPAIALDGPDRRITVARRQLDLAADLTQLALPAGSLVTASALLDLVSRDWIEGLCDRICAAGLPALFALSYDGRIVLEPDDPRDRQLRDLVNRHQRGDKGFGAALGPTASAAAAAAFARRGYRVDRAASDWLLGPADASLQRALIAGWVQAARELAPDDSGWLDDWLRQRISAIDARELRIVVGHEDLLAVPAGPA